MKKCPYCAEEIQDDVIFCNWCWKYLGGGEIGKTASIPLNKSTDTKVFEKRMFPRDKKGWLELLFSSRGRISKANYFGMTLAITFVVPVMYWIFNVIFPDSSIVEIFFTILGFLTVIPLTMLLIKRFHDLDKSGWYALLALVPLINIVIGWILILKTGTKGPNNFGDEP